VKTINVLLVAALLTITMAAATPGGDTNESGRGDWDGRLYINGTLASDGTLLCAYVNGVETDRTTIGADNTSGMYLVALPGKTGDSVTFKVFCDSDYPAKEGAQAWAISLPRHHLNLTIDHAATVGGASDIVSNGTGTLSVKVNDVVPDTDTYFEGVENVNITNSNGTILSFDYNFSTAQLNLSKVNITIGTNGDKSYITISGVNLTGAQSGTKTIKLYGVTTSYNGICVKDAENVTYVQISSDCSSADETKLKCDGSTTSGKTCTLSGTTLTVSGLTHSALMQYTVPAAAQNTVYSSSSGTMVTSASPTPTATAVPTATPAASAIPTPVISATPIQEVTPTYPTVVATVTPAASVAPYATPASSSAGGFDWTIAIAIAAVAIAGAYFLLQKKN